MFFGVVESEGVESEFAKFLNLEVCNCCRVSVVIREVLMSWEALQSHEACKCCQIVFVCRIVSCRVLIRRAVNCC